MLEVDTDVIKGIMFVNLSGELTNDTMRDVEDELNYLLYKQGMHFFIFNFKNVNVIEYSALNQLQKILIEIFLSCGNVVMCGMSDICRKKLGLLDRVNYTNSEIDAFKLLNV